MVSSFIVQYEGKGWGNEGGYEFAPDISGNLNTTSNKGEYGPGQQDAHIVDTGFAATQKWRPLNAYSSSNNFDCSISSMICSHMCIWESILDCLYVFMIWKDLLTVFRIKLSVFLLLQWFIRVRDIFVVIP